MVPIPKAYHDAKHFIEYDTSQWPFVYCVVNPIDPTTETFKAHLDCFGELLKRDEPFCILYNLTNACMVSVHHLQTQIAFTKDMEDKILENLKATALVTENVYVKQMLEMLFTLKPPLKPNTITVTLQESHAWLQTHMA